VDLCFAGYDKYGYDKYGYSKDGYDKYGELPVAAWRCDESTSACSHGCGYTPQILLYIPVYSFGSAEPS